MNLENRMVLNWSPILNWLTVGMSFTGFIGFLILIYRFFREKPILDYSLGYYYHVYDKPYNTSHIFIPISIDNTGERGTTIKYIDLIEMNPKEHFKLAKKRTDIYKHIPPHTSLPFRYGLSFNNYEIKEEEIELVFDIINTHSTKRMNITTRLLKR